MQPGTHLEDLPHHRTHEGLPDVRLARRGATGPGVIAEVELRLPPDIQYVGLARLVICVAARQAGMSTERVEDLRIAVSEATTNAILAHRRSGRSDPVVLSFGEADGSFAVTVTDAGP